MFFCENSIQTNMTQHMSVISGSSSAEEMRFLTLLNALLYAHKLCVWETVLRGLPFMCASRMALRAIRQVRIVGFWWLSWRARMSQKYGSKSPETFETGCVCK